MKAIVQERLGPPDSLQVADIDLPDIGPGDVLVRVHAAALNPHDWHMLRGDPCVMRLTGAVGMTRPKARVAGVDAAGRVEAVGANVRGLRPGDEVLAHHDVILDTIGNRPLSAVRRALTPTGTLVLGAGGSPGHLFGAVGPILKAVVVNGFVGQRLRPLPTRQKREDLLTLTGLIEAGSSR